MASRDPGLLTLLPARFRPAQLAFVAVAVALAYYLGAQLGIGLTFPPATTTSVLWPPNSILTAALLLLPVRYWWVCLAGALPVHVLLELDAGFPPYVVALLFVTNSLEALIAAGGLRLLSDSPTEFNSLRRVATFIGVAGLAAPILSSFADAAVVHTLQGLSYWDTWRVRTYSNVLTELSVVPVAVLGVTAIIRGVRRPSGRRALEAGLLAAGVVASAAWVFGGGLDMPGIPPTPSVLLLPFYFWAAARFGVGAVSAALFATAFAASYETQIGHRPFDVLPPAESLMAVQMYLIVMGIPLMCVAGLLDERRAGEANLQGPTAFRRTARDDRERLRAATARFRVQRGSAAHRRVLRCRLRGPLASGRARQRAARRVAVEPRCGRGSGRHQVCRVVPGGIRRRAGRRTVDRRDTRTTCRPRPPSTARLFADSEYRPRLPYRCERAARSKVRSRLPRCGPATGPGGICRGCCSSPRFSPPPVRAGRRRSRSSAARQKLASVARLSSMGELTASLAHQLNQPLTGIRNNAEAAQRFIDSGHATLPQLRDILADIVDDDERAAAVIRRVREMLGRSEWSPRRLDANALVQDVAVLIESDAVLRNVAVSFDFAPEPVYVNGNRIDLEQALLNVVTNAMDAVADRPVPQRIVDIQTRQHEGGGVHLVIRDRGTGLPAGSEERIFEPFVTTKPTGMGMGLAVARSVVDNHGGSIRAANHPEGGAVFTISIPEAAAAT